ncbi:hypothetical protein H6P81_009938 [Aristolochia fimbriata]|uniref:Uncharacterized protein n=1 Tax=Aristolochia fimbriata TaxID=158543 RepID=A0AAV7ERS9_ARIFI|nr:hypothetical protein H6P81_009938 [Aristolochia fimbriata]
MEEEQNQQIEEEQKQQQEKLKLNMRTKDTIERCLAQSKKKDDGDLIIEKEVEELEAGSNKVLEKEIVEQKAVGSSKLELKPLPNNLKYVFLEEKDEPVIISSCLTYLEDKMLIEVLSKYKKEIG